MQNRVYKNYNLGEAAWNQLTKSDYLQLINWMNSLCSTDSSNADILNEIVVKYKSGNESRFSTEEFMKFFSDTTIYNEIKVIAYWKEGGLFLSCDFSEQDIWRGISASGEAFTPELEDLANEIKKYVEDLFRINQNSLPEVNKEDEMIENLTEVKSNYSENKMPIWTIIGVLIAAAALAWAIMTYFI